MYNPYASTFQSAQPSHMTQPNNMQYLLDYQNSLQNQLNQVNSVLTQYPQQPTQANQTQSVQQTVQSQPQPVINNQQMMEQQALAELEVMIDRVVKQNLSKVRFNQHQEQRRQQPLDDIVQVIGEGMSKEDQMWFSSNLTHFCDFMKTQEGEEVVDFVLDSFKGYHKNLLRK